VTAVRRRWWVWLNQGWARLAAALTLFVDEPKALRDRCDGIGRGFVRVTWSLQGSCEAEKRLDAARKKL
jgi:hypothetical protein